MPSIIAIVSKAVFEKEAKGLTEGDVWATARYASQTKALAPLADGGDLYLVTVRPPDEALWLVAVLRDPKQAQGEWRATANVVAIRDISDVKTKLSFGLPTEKGKLGMSLQTPRVLAPADIALLDAGAPRGKPGASTAKGTSTAKATSSKAAASKSTTARSKTESAADGPADLAAARDVVSEIPAGRLAELDDALEHLRAGRATAALDDALAAWRKLRAPALGELVELIDKQARRGKPVIEVDAWLDLASQRDVADVGRLVATLGDTTVVKLKARYELLLAFAPDPRLQAQALAIPPRFSYEAGPAMSRAFEMAERAADVASRKHVEAAIEALAPQKTDSKPRVEYLEKHRRRGEKVLAALPAKIAVPAAVKAQVDACVKACRALLDVAHVPEKPAPAKKQTGGKQLLDELLKAVLDDPEDDHARAVYADALQQKGDPRGEFIAMQLAGKPANELLKKHIHEWLHPIGAVLQPNSIKFARGFLDTCRVELKTLKQKALFDHPLWSTVRELDCDNMALVTRPALKSLRRATITPTSLSTLAGRKHVPLEAVIGSMEMVYGLKRRSGIEIGKVDMWKKALDVGGLTKLVALELAAGDGARTPDDFKWLLKSKLGQQLTDLDLFGGRREIAIAPWIAYLAGKTLRARIRFTNGNTASGSKETIAIFDLVPGGKTVAVTLSINQDTADRDFWAYSIGGQIERAIADVPKSVAPAITVKYIGSKKRTKLGFPGIAQRLDAAFANVELT